METYPSLYQINTRMRVNELSRELGRPATLDDISDAELDMLAERGFDWVWFLGVWQTGQAGRQVSLTNPEWRREFQNVLPDLSDADICGSCFAIAGYFVDSGFGGRAALERLRDRLQRRSVRLLLDFVPNHTAPDHPWVSTHPQFYVQGTDADLARAPENYRRVETSAGPLVLALGRDPYFPGWPDTFQLNYGSAQVQEAMRTELSNVAQLCDGVRCDMAMLILPQVFERTWGIAAAPFWPTAIQKIKENNPQFIFMAEVYWDLEWTLQQQGFDYTYDKRYYDRLHGHQSGAARDHLRADLKFQRKSVRFLENHDEPRAAAIFSDDVHQAAAVLTFFVPGLRFFHNGQIDGYKVRLPVHLCRRPAEATNPELRAFYGRLLPCLRQPVVRDGDWQLLDCLPAWNGNPTSDGFIAFGWTGRDGSCVLVAVNYAGTQGQCYVRIPFAGFAKRQIRFRDMMSSAEYIHNGSQLQSDGLFLDLPAWGYHVFELSMPSDE